MHVVKLLHVCLQGVGQRQQRQQQQLGCHTVPSVVIGALHIAYLYVTESDTNSSSNLS
jgi:hypothetical protein